MKEIILQLPTNAFLALIIFYQACLSPLKPQVCRFYPTCSQYYYDAVARYGLLKGSELGIRRILCCHPFHPGGYDPVK
ncbi:MAG: membrane protein insertion efficiency factor YidD [Bacillota bacterium]